MTFRRSVTCSEEALAALLGAADEGLMAFDAQGTVIFANRAAASLLGWQPDDLVGTPSHSLGIPELERRIERALGKGAHTTGRFRLEIGERSLSGHTVRGRGGEHTLSLALRDETELIDERDRNEAVLAATADGLVLLDPSDSVTYINPAALDMLSTTRRKVLGKTVSIDALLGLEPTDARTERGGTVYVREEAGGV
jgi:PAS domain S-box-containing protein